MSVPEEQVAILFNDGKEEAERQIKSLCIRLLPGWASLDVHDLQVSPISGGISNLLVKVEPPSPLQPMAVKVFGDKTELLIDRVAEKQLLLRLNDVGFGAPVVGLFDNGRIERFLIAKTLTPEEMCDPRFIPHIARRLRAFHDLDLDGAVSAAGAAGAAVVATAAAAAARSAASPTASAEPAPAPGPGPQGASQWDAIFGWLAMAEGLSFPHDAAKQALYDKVDFDAMRRELEGLRRACERVSSPRVLCHNDLLSGNILVVQRDEEQGERPGQGQQQGQGPQAAEQRGQEEPGTAGTADGASGEADFEVLDRGSLQFIDFEYSCYGPRGFDFGNHFNEYAGFDCVYERFPSSEQQRIFFRHYLQPGELQRLAREHLKRHTLAAVTQAHNGPTANGLGPGHGDAEAVQGAGGAASADARDEEQEGAAALAAAEEAVLDRMVAEACVFALASHAYWGVWSFIQARYSPIDFDYLSYSKMRWDEYHRRKEEFLALADRAFPQ